MRLDVGRDVMNSKVLEMWWSHTLAMDTYAVYIICMSTKTTASLAGLCMIGVCKMIMKF